MFLKNIIAKFWKYIRMFQYLMHLFFAMKVRFCIEIYFLVYQDLNTAHESYS